MTTPPYIVQATGCVVFPQRNSPTHDGRADENAKDNCGESCVCTLLRAYNVRRPDGSLYEPDDIHDWLFPEGRTQVVTYDTDIKKALSGLAGIQAVTRTPTAMQNGWNGLLDLEWQALKRGIPVIGSFFWIDDAGVVHSDVPHWLVIWRQTEVAVDSLDSWPYPDGGGRHESYLTHFQRSENVLIIPSNPPLG